MELKVLKDAKKDFLYNQYVSEDDSTGTERGKVSLFLKQ